MAKTSKGKKRKPSAPLRFRGEVAGLLLIALALVTLFGILSVSQGTITATWLKLLFLAFGYGAYVTPFGFGAIGLWLILKSIGREPDIEPEKPVGVAVLFLLGLAVLHMLPSAVSPRALAASGNGGGYLGWLLSQALIRGLGGVGAWIVAIAGLLVGVLMTAGISLSEMAGFVRAFVARVRRGKAPPYTVNEGRASAGSPAEPVSEAAAPPNPRRSRSSSAASLPRRRGRPARCSPASSAGRRSGNCPRSPTSWSRT